MKIDGDVKRGKIRSDTLILFLLSLAILGIGITFIFVRVADDPYGPGEHLVRALGVIAIIAGTGCTSSCWNLIQHELHPFN